MAAKKQNKKTKGGSGKASSKKQSMKRKPAEEEESSSSEEVEEFDQTADDDSESGSDEESPEDEQEKNKGFTDENAAWLKPKKKASQLLGSSDEESESEEEESDEELLEVEREARLIDEEMEAEKAEAEEEMRRTVSEHTSIYHLPTKEELEKDLDRVVPPSEIRSHIDSILEVLADFKSRREEGRSRKEYVDQLGSFLAELNGYLPELVEYFLTMFGPAETVEFVNASEKPRPLVIRTNTLKTRRKDLAAALIKRGVSLDPLASWSKVGLKIVESPVPIGATPEYLTGMYMLQSAASMCPVLALAPEPKERILDMSAAPGGKTSYIAQLMRNTGCLVANDLKADRQKATVANMHRLGVKNVIACTHDGRKLGHLFRQNRFDRILLDAPCSGLGVISRDPSVKVQRTIADVKQTAHLQKELLLSAIDALKVCKNTKHKKSAGTMVYSTCSVSVFENEQVVQYALSKRDIRIVDTGLDFGQPGFTRYQQYRFHPSMALTRRFYPHVHNMDGFFVCKIEKLSDKRLDETQEPKEAAVAEEVPEETEPEKREEEKKKKKGKKKINGKRKQTDTTPKPQKDTNVSIPPKRAKIVKKKQKTSAKMSKPRRVKIPEM